MKRHWMPLYIADYLAGTSHLTTVEHGAYLLLIMHYWIKGEPPENDDIARRVTRMTNRQWAKSSPVLKSLFGDGWRHEMLDAELAKVIEKSASASANARRSHADRRQSAANLQDTNTHHNQNHIFRDVGGKPRAPTEHTAAEEALNHTVVAFLRAAGFANQSQAPVTWYNLRDRAALWLARGYSTSLIAEETRIVAAKSETPKPIAYFEKVFATAFARLQQPLPVVITPQSETAHVRQRSSQRQTLQEALNSQVVRAEGHGDGVGSRQVSQVPARLLPPG